MEPTNETKRAIIESLIAQLEQSKFTNEVMGKTWQTIGNADAAKKSVEAVTENVKAIAELTRQLEAIV